MQPVVLAEEGKTILGLGALTVSHELMAFEQLQKTVIRSLVSGVLQQFSGRTSLCCHLVVLCDKGWTNPMAPEKHWVTRGVPKRLALSLN